MFKKIIAACTVALFFACTSNDNPTSGGSEEPPFPPPSEGGKGPVSYYGKLKVRPGTSYLDGSKNGSGVQVRGVSFGWSTQEAARFYAAVPVKRMAEVWKAEIVRAAYGSTSSDFSGQQAGRNRGRIETVVEAAIENDIYVIIDWHSHNAHNEVQQSKDFFGYMAEKYGSYDNVIFEIFNEPVCRANSTTNTSCAASERISWAEIKSYAEQIIPVIREHSSNLILVGTPQWSQRVQDVIGNKLNDENVGYVYHFYAASHSLGGWRNNIENALNSGVPIFITEYGTTNSDGGQNNNYNTHNADRTDEWHGFMDEKKISSAAWQISDKYEGSAFFGIQGAVGAFDLDGDWADQSKMTESGKYIFNKLNGYSQNAPWRN
ncbi:MAG: glycoside hydrolase family 5 protein [Fibromonadales bacterium]|nr:glycoside hydrolase family 5 protein [Fibromonadales bacterium]